MTAVPILVFLAVLVAAAAGLYLLVPRDTTDRDVKKRLALLELRGIDDADVPDVLKSELLSDVPAFDRILSRFDTALRIDRRLKQAGLEMRVGVFLLVSSGALVAGWLAGTLAHWPFVFALLLGVILMLAPTLYVNARRRRRRKLFMAHFPDALEMFGRSLRAGHSFTGAIQLVGQEMPDPIGAEFRQVFDEQNLGIPLRDALTGMTERVDSLEVRFFATAILVQKETGGNLAEIVDRIAQVIRERFRIQGQLKIFTAQARMTGTILTLLPIAVAAAIGILNPDYLRPLWAEKPGHIMIGVAVFMQIAGAFAIRKIIRIKI